MEQCTEAGIMNFTGKDINIVMDGECNMHYAGFYIYGLKKLYGKNAKFSFSEFNSIKEKNKVFVFKIILTQRTYNIAIDFHDERKVDEDILVWSDIYAKINFNTEITKELFSETLKASNDEFMKHFDKIYSISPGFGIRVFNLSQTLNHIFNILRNTKFEKLIGIKKTVLDNVRMYIKRLPIYNYSHLPFENNYVFLIASIWHKTTAYVNLDRANFIRACKMNSNVQFEGGLIDIGYECDYIKDLDELKIGDVKVKLSEYIQKTQKSNFVFNTPSVGRCHGWKLAEYLCMGKAIISTPLSNNLPFPLVHGKNIHFVEENLESIKTAIDYLLKNPDYVKRLEKGALEYWNNFGAPQKVIQDIISEVLST
jgi:glycosyltransferase involved in cell wall biosynthesis